MVDDTCPAVFIALYVDGSVSLNARLQLLHSYPLLGSLGAKKKRNPSVGVDPGEGDSFPQEDVVVGRGEGDPVCSN